MAHKESQKWIGALQQTIARTPDSVQVITVADRESDVYEFLLLAEQQSATYVIRAGQDRRLMVGGHKLWRQLQQRTIAGYLSVAVAAKKKEPSRTASVSVRYAEVEIRPPQRLKKLRPAAWQAVRLWAVYVREEQAPAKVTPLEWMLLTNVEVVDLAAAVQRIEWYVLRWLIELYFKILKSGCRVEQCLLSSRERLQRYLALMGVVAWRLFWLTYVNRQHGQGSCESVLAQEEWQALSCRVKKTTRLPEQPPTVSEVIRWIAQLGGFLSRKADGEPGITVIWRGWQRLNDMVSIWRLLKPT